MLSKYSTLNRLPACMQLKLIAMTYTIATKCSRLYTQVVVKAAEVFDVASYSNPNLRLVKF